MSHWNSVGLASILLAAVSGCSSSDSKEPREPTSSETYLGLAIPTDGFQVRSQGAAIPPGADQEYCEVAELPGKPGDVYYANSAEMGNAKGSHHLNVLVAPPGGKAEAKMREMNVGDKVPCVAATMVFGEDLQTVGGIQHPNGEMSFPEGVAIQYYGGQRLVFDYHYFNSSDEPVEARSAVNFHLVKKAEVKQLAAVFGFSNWTIDTAPGHTKAFTADCRFEHDVKVGMLGRHTHQWGRDFSTWFAGGPRDAELIWSTPSYEEATDHIFEDAPTVRAGGGFRFRCTYENTEGYALRFGTAAKDEMCILFGTLWDDGGAYEAPKEDCSVTWIDAEGIGRDAKVDGAFPAPSAEVAALCLAGAGADATECTQCVCNSCGAIAVACFTDADCGPIAQASGPDRGAVIAQHSSGAGLSQQLGACVQTKCQESCTAGPSN